MNTILLIISLVIACIGILTVVYGYQKDKTSNPQAASILGKRIFVLTLVVAVLNCIVPIINHLKPKTPSQASQTTTINQNVSGDGTAVTHTGTGDIHVEKAPSK